MYIVNIFIACTLFALYLPESLFWRYGGSVVSTVAFQQEDPRLDQRVGSGGAFLSGVCVFHPVFVLGSSDYSGYMQISQNVFLFFDCSFVYKHFILMLQ